MKSDEFEKLDQEMMKSTAPLRERKVNPKLLEGFAVSVERRLQSRKSEAPARSPVRTLVPMLAVLVLAVVAVMRYSGPASVGTSSGPAEFQLAQRPAAADPEGAIADEIEALRELGVWTSEDEEAAGVAPSEAEELEMMLG